MSNEEIVRQGLYLSTATHEEEEKRVAALLALADLLEERKWLREAVDKAVETFVDLEQALRMIGRDVLADACVVAVNGTRELAGSARVLGAEKEKAAPSEEQR